LSVAGGTSTVLKSAGLTISAHARYFTRIGVSFSPLLS
jgi:hypothetical protein